MSLTINQLSHCHLNKETLFEYVSFSIRKGEKVSLIGKNGSGKSTLLRILAGETEIQSGDVIYTDKPYYIPQHFGQYDNLTVAGALRIEYKLTALHNILNGSVNEEDFNQLNEDWQIEEKVLTAFEKWDLGHIELSRKMSTLSGGEKTKVFLSGISIHAPEIILFDEPTNHLDKGSRKKLYEFIQQTKSTLLIVSHDRTLLNLVNYTCELHPDRVECYGGNYEFYKAQKAEKINALQEQLSEKEKELRRAKKVAREAIERKEKDGIRGKKRKEKENALPALMNKLKGKAEKSTAKLKEVHAEKMENIVDELKDIQQKLPTANDLKVNFKNTELHKGKILVSAKRINFGYNADYLWTEGLDFQIRSGERIVISGKNGSGKTSLLKLILGELEPASGEITRADFSFLHVDQEYSIIDNNLTVFEQVQKFNKQNFLEHELKTLLHRFLFTYDTWDKTCDKLSGGEKMKLVFCCLQVSNNMPDFFALDEPTNNLDIQSIDIITSVIKSYQGTLLLISHDGYFIREIGIDREIGLD